MSSASQDQFAFAAILSALPADGTPPEWITIFPTLGRIDTRDGRTYHVDAAALISRFNQDGVDLPIDVNHATDAGFLGGRSDAVGWISELAVVEGALKGRVEWLDEGRALLAAKKYRFISPSFHHTSDGKATWLKAVALVTAPALVKQPALASASAKEDRTMKELAAALGVVADADEKALVAALAAGFVPKKNHDEVLAQLAASQAKLSEIEAAGRKARVDALLDGALKEKKIVPAEKDHYAQLCASDAGFESVKALLAAKTSVLAASGLDDKKTPEGGSAPMTPALLAAKASKMVETGEAPDYLSALSILSDRQDKVAA